MAEPLIPIREVAGLEIPADLAANIVSSFREMYPTICDGKDDDAAVRSVLIWFITATMETAANRKASAALTATIDQLRAGAEVRAEQRRGQIHAAAQRIKEKPAITPPTE